MNCQRFFYAICHETSMKCRKWQEWRFIKDKSHPPAEVEMTQESEIVEKINREIPYSVHTQDTKRNGNFFPVAIKNIFDALYK